KGGGATPGWPPMVYDPRDASRGRWPCCAGPTCSSSTPSATVSTWWPRRAASSTSATPCCACPGRRGGGTRGGPPPPCGVRGTADAPPAGLRRRPPERRVRAEALRTRAVARKPADWLADQL